jgi:hypothetical protein
MQCWCEDTECKSTPSRTPLRKSNTNRASYVWGDTVAKAKTQCESLDYLFQLAVEMHKLGIPWTEDAMT